MQVKMIYDKKVKSFVPNQIEYDLKRGDILYVKYGPESGGYLQAYRVEDCEIAPNGGWRTKSEITPLPLTLHADCEAYEPPSDMLIACGMFHPGQFAGPLCNPKFGLQLKQCAERIYGISHSTYAPLPCLTIIEMMRELKELREFKAGVLWSAELGGENLETSLQTIMNIARKRAEEKAPGARVVAHSSKYGYILEDGTSEHGPKLEWRHDVWRDPEEKDVQPDEVCGAKRDHA